MALIRISEPYDFELSTERFRAFGPDLANLWHEGGLHRVVQGRELRIEAASGGVLVEAADGGAEEGIRGKRDVAPLDREALSTVRHLLGLPFDLPGFEAFAASDPVLAKLVARLRGLRPPLAPDPFEALVTSITAQQVSLFAAFAVRNRLIERFGQKAGYAFAFPSRERLARAREAELGAVGFSRRKAEYVLALARSELDLGGVRALEDGDVKARIMAQRGLGEWTADWFLARHLARPRAWPAGDLGLRKAVAAFYGVDGDLREFGVRFDPFQNLAGHYLLVGLRI